MPHASCSKPPKSTLELEIKCYGEIPPVALSLRSCCLCYRDLSHSVTPVRRPSRTAAASRRPNSPLILSAKDHLVTAEFPQEGFTESILAWADLMLLREIQTTSSQDLREVRFSHYHCFCSQGCVRGGWLWQITCHCTWCDHSLAGNTSFPSHAWSFHETRYHTNQIVVEFFPKLPLSSDVSFLLLTNSASVPLAVAGTQDRPGCQLILYDLFQNSFSTFKIKLCARYSDLIQLLPINQLMVWPCVEVFFAFCLWEWTQPRSYILIWHMKPVKTLTVLCLMHLSWRKSLQFSKQTREKTFHSEKNNNNKKTQQRKERKIIKDTINLLFLF